MALFTDLNTIPGLTNWYDASNPNGNGIIPSNQASINTWVDKSRNANNMIAQIAGTYATNSQNGLGTITFNNSWYRTATANAPYPLDVYVVVKLNSLTTPVDVIGTGSSNSDNFNSLTFSEYTTGKWMNGSTNFSRTPNAVASNSETLTTFLLMEWSISNNNFYIKRNSIQIMSTNTYTWTQPPNQEFRIGNRQYYNTSNLFKGSIAEVAFFNSNLVTSNRQTVEGYLAWKWGINSSLPMNHPYYYSPPTIPACFLIGSKILTNKGYIPIEYLRKGDLVKTLKNDYLPIVLIGKSPIYNSGNLERIKNRLYILHKHLFPTLSEDLVLTGCHSLLVNGLYKEQIIEMGGPDGRLYKTDDKLRLFTCFEPRAIPYQKEGTFIVYHLSLESDNDEINFGIWANGLLVESCSKSYLTELSGMEFIE